MDRDGLRVRIDFRVNREDGGDVSRKSSAGIVSGFDFGDFRLTVGVGENLLSFEAAMTVLFNELRTPKKD